MKSKPELKSERIRIICLLARRLDFLRRRETRDDTTRDTHTDDDDDGGAAARRFLAVFAALRAQKASKQKATYGITVSLVRIL